MAMNTERMTVDAVAYVAHCRAKNKPVKLQPLFAAVMWGVRVRLGRVEANALNDPKYLVSYRGDAYPFIRDVLLPLCDKKDYKQPTCQLREEMQRWERNGYAMAGTFGDGEFYWSSKEPPQWLRPMPPQGRKYARKNHVIANPKRVRKLTASIIAGAAT